MGPVADVDADAVADADADAVAEVGGEERVERSRIFFPKKISVAFFVAHELLLGAVSAEARQGKARQGKHT